MTKYALVKNRDPVFQGDTLDGLVFKMFDKDSEVIVPESICAQMRGPNGQLVHEFITSIDPDGTCKVSGLETQETPPGKYVYSVRVKMFNGRVRNYIHGSITIISVPTRC